MYFSFILSGFPIIAVLCAAVCAILFFLLKKRGRRATFVRYLAIWGFACYSVALIYFTLLWYWPDITFTPEWHLLNLEPFVWIKEVYTMGKERMIEQLLLNIAMFVPLGVMLPIVFKSLRRIWRTGLMSLGATLTIETLQYFMGRSADIDDVIMNFAGGIIGYALFKLLNAALRKTVFWNNALEQFK